MTDWISKPAPKRITDVLDASVRAIAKGDVVDANVALSTSRRLLAEYEAGAVFDAGRETTLRTDGNGTLAADTQPSELPPEVRRQLNALNGAPDLIDIPEAPLDNWRAARRLHRPVTATASGRLPPKPGGSDQ